MTDTATLLVQCNDNKGILAKICGFIHENQGNIINLQEHVEPKQNRFFTRVEWQLDGFKHQNEYAFKEAFEKEVAQPFEMTYTLHYSHKRSRVAIFVSKYSHCLEDILYRYSNGELNIEIPVIISNHIDLRYLAQRYDIEFVHLHISKKNKKEQEKKQIELLEKNSIDLVVLARYMQILSDDFTKLYEHQIINIHHSFLPAFSGAKPYHAAYKRGVKMIGATAHFVTKDLDEGPIISQNIANITHRDTVQDMVIKGRDIERIVLSNAIKLFVNNKVMAWNNRTVVFS